MVHVGDIFWGLANYIQPHERAPDDGRSTLNYRRDLTRSPWWYKGVVDLARPKLRTRAFPPTLRWDDL